MLNFLAWLVLLIFCWPLALLALILYPIVWLLALPFRLVGITVDAVFGLLKAVLFLPGPAPGRPAARLTVAALSRDSGPAGAFADPAGLRRCFGEVTIEAWEELLAYLTGSVHGNTITLDEPVPSLEGRRVVVQIEPLPEDADVTLSPELQERLWKEWVERGPQGPILP